MKLPLLANEITNKEKFRDLYQFTFNFAKTPGQKSLGKLDETTKFFKLQF